MWRSHYRPHSLFTIDTPLHDKNKTLKFFNDSSDGAARNGYMIFLSNQLYLLSAVHSGVGTGGSGDSMNRDPRAPGAPSSGAREKF